MITLLKRGAQYNEKILILFFFANTANLIIKYKVFSIYQWFAI